MILDKSVVIIKGMMCLRFIVRTDFYGVWAKSNFFLWHKIQVDYFSKNVQKFKLSQKLLKVNCLKLVFDTQMDNCKICRISQAKHYWNKNDSFRIINCFRVTYLTRKVENAFYPFLQGNCLFAVPIMFCLSRFFPLAAVHWKKCIP